MNKFALTVAAAGMIFVSSSALHAEVAPVAPAEPAQVQQDGYLSCIKNKITSNCAVTWIKANPKTSVAIAAAIIAAYAVYKAYENAQNEAEVSSPNFTTSK